MVRSQGNLLCICRWAPAESGKVRAFWDGIQPDAGKKSLAGVTGESVEAAQMCTGYGVKDPEATAMGESALYWRPFHHKPHRKAWESMAKVSFKVRNQRRGLPTHESTQRPSPLPPLQNKNLNLCVVGGGGEKGTNTTPLGHWCKPRTAGGRKEGKTNPPHLQEKQARCWTQNCWESHTPKEDKCNLCKQDECLCEATTNPGAQRTFSGISLPQ